jgi:ankyrin repeat protein
VIRTLASILFLAALIGFAAYSEVRERTLASRQAQLEAERKERSETEAELRNDQFAPTTLDVNLITEAGWGHTEKVKLLIESGADVNARDTNGDTPLIAAASMGFEETIRLLLNKGADVNAQNHAGSTALMEAAVMNSPNSVVLLMAGGASTETKNLAHFSAADLARREKHFEIVQLLETGVIPKAARSLSLVAIDAHLQRAAAEGDVSKTKELLAGGANVNATNKAGWTAVMQAAAKGKADVVELLIANGADVNRVETRNGRTALILAAMEGHAEVVETLLKNGANPNTKDNTGETAISVVMQSGNDYIGRLLKRAGAKTPLYNQVLSQPQDHDLRF